MLWKKQFFLGIEKIKDNLFCNTFKNNYIDNNDFHLSDNQDIHTACEINEIYNYCEKYIKNKQSENKELKLRNNDNINRELFSDLKENLLYDYYEEKFDKD